MSLERISTEEASPAAGPYNQAIKAGNFVFVSGQLPIDQANKAINGSITDQTQQIVKNIASILKAAGTDISKVVKTTVFLTDMSNFAEMNVAYEKLFVGKPARSCVAVKELPKGFPVEIECIAVI